MMEFVVRSCGVFFVPQLVLSALTVALVLGYTIAWARGELRRDHPTWERTLDPLAGVAVTVGLLGSVVSFCVAFGGFPNAGFEIHCLGRLHQRRIDWRTDDAHSSVIDVIQVARETGRRRR